MLHTLQILKCTGTSHKSFLASGAVGHRWTTLGVFEVVFGDKQGVWDAPSHLSKHWQVRTRTERILSPLAVGVSIVFLSVMNSVDIIYFAA